jgi:tRNA/tmRNA/rRNA uracil-C5-methylase (TrmA/RlmC/RlmD family)
MICGSVRHALRDLGKADVAVLDPPRAGAGRDVIGRIAEAGVPRVIHIGCEAAAFARDVGLYLERGYQVRELRLFDAFPLTHHIESFALLTR